VPIATPKFIERAQSFGIAVFVWTINDRPTMERLLDLGVDGIMTDEVELLREVFTERGLWPPANPATL
jgi:glycerophosphoryl diester phosphodiesterase